MMRLLLQKLPGILLLLLLCSTSCTKEVPLPVLVPRTPCPLQAVQPFPDLGATVCGDKVCLPADRAAAIYVWVKSAERAIEMANVCLSDADTPPVAKHLSMVPYQPHATVDAIVAGMGFAGHVKVTVIYLPCGEVNALYSPPAKSLLICDELMDGAPELLPLATAHEMAHAVIDQLHIPFTGSEEAAADELAEVWLSLHGRQADLVAAALHFGGSANSSEWPTDDPLFWDEHPADARRAFAAVCMASGSQGDPQFGCDEIWMRAAKNWYRLLQEGLRG